jgi:nicotinamidase-related amidase
MPKQTLHHDEADRAPVALLLIDVINPMDFEGGEDLLEYARPMAHRIADLKRRAEELGIPVLYVNDNFGRWQSDFNKLVSYCIEENTPGKEIVELLRPGEDDYFVLKPKHSGFYLTTLATLLNYLSAKVLILTGVAGDICVLFTASDAYMYDFDIIVPADCVASERLEYKEQALQLMKRVIKADITPSTELDLEALLDHYQYAEKEERAYVR